MQNPIAVARDRGCSQVHRLLVPMVVALAVSAAPKVISAKAPPPQRTLLTFGDDFDPARVTTTDAQATKLPSNDGGALRVTTGHAQTWPGVALKAPQDRWDLSAYDQVSLHVKNTGTNRATVFCRVDNPGADGTEHCVTGSVSVEPGKSATLKVPLKRAADSKLGRKLFGMRGYPVAAGGPGTVDPAQINQLLVFVSKPSADHVFEIDQVRAEGTYVAPTAWANDADPFFPFIDTFGQYKHKDWPGKTHSLAELQTRREQEAQELSDKPAPSGWDRYGGCAAGPQLKATGFFRTEKFQGKWWLVDPDGHLFFSQGIDCVRMRDVTPIDERADWFEAFPGNQPDFKTFLAQVYALKGHYAGHTVRGFSFCEANVQRKYGPEWPRVYPELIHRRLRSWGLNSIGMWSDQRVCLLRHTPYVDSIGSRGVKMIEGSEGYWGKFPDVWDDDFAKRLRQAMAVKVGASAGDPWCLGYFADNEMSWGDETSLGLGALQSPATQPAKRKFVADLKDHKYSAIDKLNAAWDTTYSSWEAVLESTTPPDKKKAYDDLAAFYTKTAEKYFQTVRDSIKELAPNQLYLGCRFAWVNPLAAAAAARYCDIVSYNLYRRSVADFQFNGGADVPLIIGEFHFGALDRGMFHTGLVSVRDQAARAETYQEYVRGALRHPSFVGCHWFQYQDEPTTGRVYDEENYQIGFVDVADTPYRETIEASRAVAATMYQVRLSE